MNIWMFYPEWSLHGPKTYKYNVISSHHNFTTSASLAHVKPMWSLSFRINVPPQGVWWKHSQLHSTSYGPCAEPSSPSLTWCLIKCIPVGKKKKNNASKIKMSSIPMSFLSSSWFPKHHVPYSQRVATWKPCMYVWLSCYTHIYV